MANPYDDISLTGAAAKPSGNPYDAIPLRDPSDVRGALVSAMNANPDAAGRAARLARQIGSPAAAVEAHLPEVESIVKVDYYAKMIERAPRTEDFLRNPDKARMAHDDVENLSAWESAGQFLKNSGKALASGVPAFNEGFWGVGQAGGEVLSKLTKPLVGIGLPDVGDSAAQFFGDQRKISQAIKQSLMTVPEGNISAGWYSGLQSLTMNMLTLPAAFMSGNPVLSLVPMAATTGGQAYGQARDKGVGVGSSLAFGASQAAIEYATEKLPVAWLLKDIKAGAGFGKMLGRQMLAEVPGEQAATALQDLNEWAVLNPQKPFADYIKERPGAFVQTLVATMVGAGGQVGTIKLADMAIQAAQAKEQQAVEAGKAGQLLAEMNKLAAASKVRERDPETAREFFQSILDDGNDSVWITPDALAQSGMAEQMAQAIPAVAEQLGSASQTGHDIRIPVADLMATMAGPDLAQSILQHVATEPGGFTPTTAEEYMQSGKAEELKAEIDRVLGEKDGDDSFAASSQEVEDAVFAELQSAGRHAESVNRTDAILHRHFFSVMAAKLGEMPKALFDRYALRVVAKSGGEVDGESLDQTAWHGTPHMWAPEPGFPHGRPRLDAIREADDANILRQSDQAPRGTFNPSTNTIALLKDANLSTFLHESGHFFLEVMADLASQPMAPAAVQQDMQAVLDWFGVADLPTWANLEFEERRSYHEKFARGFELYLAEGKAPSIELHGVFQRFRAWLLKVYTSLKSLNVSLTPEVRGVFDRMLATTEDIKQAEQARSMINLFSTAEQAGMSQEGFAAYHALGTDATNAAIEELQARGMRDMQWIKNARVRVLKKLQQESKAKRAEVKMTARRDVMSQPVYRAWQFLTAKIGADDVVDVAAKPKSDPRELNPETDSLFKAIAKLGGINKAEAVSTWGTDPADKPTSGVFGMPVWRVEGGLSIDGMAEALAQHGYLTQDENGRVDVRELEQLFADELGGSPQYSNAVDASSMMDPPPKAGEDMANPGGLRAGRLNLDGLRDTSLSSDQIEVLKARRMTAAGGLHPDVVAELFPEFGSGDALVQALVAAVPPLEMIDALTDQRMLEQFGELSSPEAIAQAADMAIHNEVRARAIATELATLEKALNVRGDAGNDRNGRRRTFAVLPAAAREFSNAMISRLKIRDIKPAQYSGAAARAGRAAVKAEKGGDIETAASEKRTQLLNIYATRAAHEAIEEARKIDEFFRRVIGGKDATVGKSRDIDLVNAARAVLAAYGYGGKAKSAVAYVEVVQKNDPTWMADVIRKAVEEAEANGKPIRDLTLDELRALKEDVDSLWHLAERSRTMEIDGVLMDRKTVADALFRRMQELGIPQHAPGESSSITDDEMRAMNFSSVKAILRRVESWVDQQDGGEKFGPFRRYLWTPIKDAADAYIAEKAEKLRAFRNLFMSVAPTMRRGLIDAPMLGYVFGKDSGGVAMNEILHAILHTGNDSNKRKFLLGRGWAEKLPDGSINTARWDAFVKTLIDSGKLTKAHYDLAQSVWDLMESMKPAAQRAHRDATGKYFEEVTATPFVTPFGSYRGGYVPAMVDSRIVKDMELKKLVEEGSDGMSYVFPSTSKGFTKSRVEYDRPLLLDMRALPQHIDRVLLFSHLEVPIRDAARLIGFEPVADAINRRDPGAITGMLRPWLNRTARQQVTTPIAGAGVISRTVNTIRNRTGMAYMFANISNAAQQITGGLLAGLKVRPSSLASATVRYIKAPRETAAEVSRLSPYMAHRMDGEVHAMLGEIESIMIDPTLYERAQEWTKRHSFFLQQAVDNVMGPIIWMGAYNEAMEEKFNPKDAARLADSVIRQTQGSSLPEDISRIESGPAYARLFTQFAGYFNMQANLLGSEIGKVMQEAGLKKGAGRMAYILLLGFYAPALVAEAVAQMFKGGPGDDDKDGEYLDDWLMALFVYGPMRNITAMVPVVGAAANSAIARFNGNPVDDRMSVAPAVGAMEAGAGVPFDLYKAVKGEGDAQRAVRDVSTLISIATGLPAHALARPVGYVSGVAQGKTDPTGAIDFTRGVVTGAASPESRGR